MANVCFASYVIEGDKREIKALYDIMCKLEKRKRPLVKSDYGNRWLGCLVTKLGADYKEVYCRGSWSNLRLCKNSILTFDTETAWEPMDDVFILIKKRYPSLNIYYMSEEDGMGILITNDQEGKYFDARYRVDAQSDLEYFSSWEEVYAYVSDIVGKKIVNREELNAAVEAWNDEKEEQTDFDNEISIGEFTVEINNFT